ncbi:uncharacterized protein [Henckelia pumila]|uniref:uncharacterized protein n=1 Tax=Henckelia pumila TaxID=405737 RepID=UPI003C6E272C
MRFENKGQCNHCGKNHPTEKCRKVAGACFHCGKIGHLKRDCPKAGGVGSGSGSGYQATVQKRPHGQLTGGYNLRPSTSDQVFALRNDQAMEENERVITGTFLLCGIPAFVLIDTDASNSLISARFVKQHNLSYINLEVVLYVSTPTGHSVLAKPLVVGCPLEFKENVLMANLKVLTMEDFDCTLGIDMLTTYRASVDCYQWLVQFHPVGGDKWFFYSEGARPPMPLILALRVCHALESGGESYLIYAIDLSTGSVGTEDLPVVNEFLDVFPDEIPGFTPVQAPPYWRSFCPGSSRIFWFFPEDFADREQ